MAKDCPPEVAKAMIEKIEMNVPMNELERYVYFVTGREREGGDREYLAYILKKDIFINFNPHFNY